MFKKFTPEEIHSKANIKSSVQRTLKSKFVEQYPDSENQIDEMFPKKSQLVHVKISNKNSIYVMNGIPVLLQILDHELGMPEALWPSLRLVHQYPDAIPSIRVDRGAIKFVLSGAHIMCPGLTSKGGELPEAPGYPVGTVVAIYAEGKEHALAVGKLRMSTEDIKSENKGIGVDLVEYLGDGVWTLTDL